MPTPSSARSARRVSPSVVGIERKDMRTVQRSKDTLGKRDHYLRNTIAAVCLPTLAIGVVVVAVVGAWFQILRKSREMRGESLVQPSSNASAREIELQMKVDELEKSVEKLNHELQKSHSVWMKTKRDGVGAIHQLQETTRMLLMERYGPEPYRVILTLDIPTAVSGSGVREQEDRIIVELAPVALMPYSVYRFLELVQHFRSGEIIQNSLHAFHAKVQAGLATKRLAFQEDSSKFQHKQRALCFVGQGLAFYASVAVSTIKPALGSEAQPKKDLITNEADACFGKVIYGWDDVIIGRLKNQSRYSIVGESIRHPESKMRILQMELWNRKDRSSRINSVASVESIDVSIAPQP